jgi:diaminopropionate ammonia-lyase
MTAPAADGIRVHRNPRAAPRAESYGSARARILNQAGFVAAEEEISRWPGYAATPLHRLPGLAAKLGLAALHYKDECGRFGLKSFKALGGAYAVFRLLSKAVAARHGGEPVDSRQLIAGRWRDIVQTVTVTCATDGNHGRSVAWGAQLFGCRCVIYVHESVSEGRCAAIAQYGAEVIRVPGNYDDSVRHAADEARSNGWTVVSDTTYVGYREIPIDVMHGYGVMAREIVRALADERAGPSQARIAPSRREGAQRQGCTNDPPTHVFVQAGVGALAASVCAAFWLAWDARRPELVIVEPTRADCHFQSSMAGKPIAVTGDLDTVMAGLACGEVSPLAWEIVDAGANAYVVVDDRFALDAMRALAAPAPGDPAIVAGETGASGLAALLAAKDHTEIWQTLGLDGRSRVLLIGSEGDTDPEIYRQIVARAAGGVAT